MGLVHPRLRTVFLLQEFLQQEGKPVDVRVGSEIPADSIARIGDDREATDYLRWRSYLLGRRGKAETSWPAAVRSKLAQSKLAFNPPKPLASPIEPHFLQQELNALPADRCLAQNADFGVYLAEADEAPRLLQEVGRLREVTFRQAGEGTGNSRDLDRFDRYYWHMLLWHKTRCELAGAYRAGNTSQILAQHGVSGLYTSTLFDYDARLFERLGPALELGRSFIRAEYQRQYAPLLLLWKGIARLVARNPLATHPKISVLFGAVSISNDYNASSREMIYRFFESRIQQDELAGLVKPRSPFRPARLLPWDCRAMCAALSHMEELSQPITDVESDGKGLPVLLRQYAKVGGKLLGFNLDRKFSNVLDGLIVVDLHQTEPAVLERYMGREDAARFRQPHKL
jgi:putative hemolysin